MEVQLPPSRAVHDHVADHGEPGRAGGARGVPDGPAPSPPRPHRGQGPPVGGDRVLSVGAAADGRRAHAGRSREHARERCHGTGSGHGCARDAHPGGDPQDAGAQGVRVTGGSGRGSWWGWSARPTSCRWPTSCWKTGSRRSSRPGWRRDWRSARSPGSPGPTDGPLLLCVGGLHGNEPAGVRALEEVVRGGRGAPGTDGGGLRGRGGQLEGAGGEAAVRRLRPEPGVDGGSVDGAGVVERNGAGRGSGGAAAAGGAGRSPPSGGAGRCTSWTSTPHPGGGGAFTTTSDYLGNRRFAMEIPAPLVLGLDEAIEGTLIGYLDDFGYTTAVFECGQHNEEEAIKEGGLGGVAGGSRRRSSGGRRRPRSPSRLEGAAKRVPPASASAGGEVPPPCGRRRRLHEPTRLPQLPARARRRSPGRRPAGAA